MLDRRRFVLSSAAAPWRPARQYRAAIIGHTGRGNYGHDWDRTWPGLPGVEVVAVADPDETGARAAAARSGASRTYSDYRAMLDKEKPDLVAVCPRWLDQRLQMVLAAIEAGAHVLVEKPFAATPEDAGRMVEAAARRGVRLQMGHTARTDPVILQTRRLLQEGAIGELMEIRARGKEDARAGGEDLIVLGTHCFDLMRFFAGDPEWVFAHVTDQGREVRRGMEREPTEPVGPVAGDDITAVFRFSSGIDGHFASRRSDVRTGSRFGVTLFGSKGLIFIPLSAVPASPAMILRSPSWASEASSGWERLEPPPEAAARAREVANRRMVADLIEAIEAGREPACSARDGRWTIEMVMGVYQAHFAGARIPFPLAGRRHPLA
jgi:predicted dehydrogenase